MRALGLAFCLLASACDHGTSSVSPSGSSTATQSATPSLGDSARPTREGNPIAAPRLADADLDTLQKKLKCDPSVAAKDGPCKIVLAMQKCATWGAATPSGDGRFIGHGWTVNAGAQDDQVTILRARAVPASDVQTWQLPLKIALAQIPKDAGPAYAQAERAINAFERHDVPPPKNSAMDFLKSKSDWPGESSAARSMGKMVETFSDHPIYVCQEAQQEIVLVQQASADIGLNADGLYAELWAASW
jgi:hypothetical protein